MASDPAALPASDAEPLESAKNIAIVRAWQKAHPPGPFQPSADDLAFLKRATGIADEEALKAHVVAVQQRALDVVPYPCIYKFSFTRTSIARMDGFQRALALAKHRPGALLLDIGCCFGADARKAVFDGFPPEQIIASDLHAEFWDLGHELFRDTHASMPITFLAGDVFDPSFLSLPAPGPPSPAPGPPPPLSSLTSLTPLHGHLSAIHASLFFHLFSLAQQTALARLLAALLRPQPGSVVFGHQIGAAVAGLGRERGKWAHNGESWRAMWEGVLGEGRCTVRSTLVEANEWVRSLGIGTHTIYWSVELK